MNVLNKANNHMSVTLSVRLHVKIGSTQRIKRISSKSPTRQIERFEIGHHISYLRTINNMDIEQTSISPVWSEKLLARIQNFAAESPSTWRGSHCSIYLMNRANIELSMLRITQELSRFSGTEVKIGGVKIVNTVTPGT